MVDNRGEVKPMLRCKEIHKHYTMGDETVRALDGVDFEINKGEMVAIIGTSGSGKSTLMNILGCLDTPTSGEYWLDGKDVSCLSDDELAIVRNRKIGFVFQQFNLLPRATALENVEVPLFYRVSQQVRAKAQEQLRRVGLSHRLGHYPSQMSGGQRQRVAIARALVTEPAILLADEPTGNLDSATSDDIMKLFGDLHREGVTLIIVTHEPSIAAYCPRQIRLHDGKILHDTSNADQACELVPEQK